MDFKKQLSRLVEQREAGERETASKVARQKAEQQERERAASAVLAKRTTVLDAYIDPVFRQAAEDAVSMGFYAKFQGGAPIGRVLEASLKQGHVVSTLHALVTDQHALKFSTNINRVEKREVAILREEEITLEAVGTVVEQFFEEALKG